MGFYEKFKVIRTEHGSFVKGKYVRNGTKKEFSVNASIQPHFFRETDKLPEGRTVTDAIKIYTSEKLISQDKTFETDMIDYNGDLYEVYQVKNYNMGKLPHYKIIALRFNEEQQELRNARN